MIIFNELFLVFLLASVPLGLGFLFLLHFYFVFAFLGWGGQGLAKCR